MVTGVLMCVSIIGIPLGGQLRAHPGIAYAVQARHRRFDQARRVGYTPQVVVPTEPKQRGGLTSPSTAAGLREEQRRSRWIRSAVKR